MQTETAKINLADEAALTWYFGPGEAAFRRSTFGAMIRALDLDAHTSTPCRRCNGLGFNDDDVANTTPAIKRLCAERPTDLDVGAWEAWRAKLEQAQPRCRKCGGKGSTTARRRDRHVPRSGYRSCPTCRGIAGNDCETCHGTAVESVLSAFAGSAKHEASGNDPSDFAIERYAIVSRRLDRVPLRLVAVLEAYYGDSGGRWGRTRHGRILATYRLTAPGLKLLRRAQGKSDNPDLDLGPNERIANQLNLEALQPNPNRRRLINAADAEARTLYAASVEAWNATPRRRSMAQ